MPFTKQFTEELHKAFGPYVIEAVESESGLAGRILDDNVETGINYKEILVATSLDELKKKAEKISVRGVVMKMTRQSGKNLGAPGFMRKCLGIERLWMRSLATAFRTFRAARSSKPLFVGGNSTNSD